MTAIEREPIVAPESERSALNKIEGVFESEQHAPKLIGPHEEEIEFPPSLFYVLRQVVHHLAHGQAVTIVPLNKELTTQEAADILNVSRPHLVKLLERGDIPFMKVGTHRRIRFSDLLDYKQQRDRKRRSSLADLTQLSQELGLYEQQQQT